MLDKSFALYKFTRAALRICDAPRKPREESSSELELGRIGERISLLFIVQVFECRFSLR